MGVIDILHMKAYRYLTETLGAEYVVEEIPEHLSEEAQVTRKFLIEAAAEIDDTILENYLEEKEVTTDLLKAALRKGTVEAKFVLVLCGSAFKNKGVQPLLDAVVDYLPSPVDMPPIVGKSVHGEKSIERKPSEDEPFSGLIFKTMNDPYVGQLSFIRVYSGALRTGAEVINVNKDRRAKIGRILRMHANKREEVLTIHCGDIGAVVGLKHSSTGDTITAPGAQFLLENISFPEPVISVAIEPKTKGDQEKLALSLNKLGGEDPTFRIHTDENTGQTIISGMGELHLEILVERLLREFNVHANVGRPQVTYRETITVPATGEGKYIRQTGGRGQYGHVILEISPVHRHKGFIFNSKITGGTIPKEYIEPCRKGIEEALAAGILAGYEMDGVEVSLMDGSYHEVDSSEMAFKVASSIAFKDAAKRAEPILLEPVMEVEVVLPEEYLGDVMGDINARRGKIEKVEHPIGAQIIKASIPLAEMFGYATDLRSVTQGRANYSMQFHSFVEVPRNTQREILKRVTGQGF